jgi:predicted GNAT family N-acyltransferase
MDVVELDRLSDSQWAELQGDEVDPFDAARNSLQWGSKDRAVALRWPDGRLVASAGLVVVEVHVDGSAVIPVVGIGGVIVAAPFRGQGLGDRIVAEALRTAVTLGPGIAMLFCYRERAGLYARHGFVEIATPVFVHQPVGLVEMPMVAMWRALHEGEALPPGQVVLNSLPF